jgi:hypothetical protein
MLELRSFRVRPSRLAATAVPVLALLGGLSLGLAAPATESGRNLAQAVLLSVLAAASCVWLWADAQERRYELRASYFIGLILAPVVAVPFYFNQTRARSERFIANTWFVIITLSTFASLWLGATIAGHR